MFQFLDPRRSSVFFSQSSPNRWDWVLLPIVLAVFVLLAFAAMQMSRPFVIGEASSISLDPWDLPYYLLRTTLRMFIALAFSLLFSFIFATLAAKSRMAEKIIIPMLDILQSVPILGFQAIAIAPFIALFPGNLLGAECAALFAIFTSQVWNMAFSLYQSIKTVPTELSEAAAVFQLSSWQRFWRLELPFALPSLLWNMMMSMSGGWFFLVAAEAISVAGQDIKLAGIGSFIAVAIEARNLTAIVMAIIAMLIGILLYDQLFFRPLLAWADKFRFEELQSEQAPRSWLLDWIRRSRWMRRLIAVLLHYPRRAFSWFARRYDGTSIRARQRPLPMLWSRVWDAAVLLVIVAAIYRLVVFVASEVGIHEVIHVFGLGLITLMRVMVLIALASIVWVPIAVWVGLRPKYSQAVQAVAQFLAAFPVNLMFPLVVYVIVDFHLNPNIWLSPLIIFGTQWYLIFNVIAGASTIPYELRLAAENLGLRGWMKWKRFYLPAIFPSYVTGAITASGGSWNASIVAEYVSWGKTHVMAVGLGSYIKQMTDIGDFPRIALGIGVMCVFVSVWNRLFWRRLYVRAEHQSA